METLLSGYLQFTQMLSFEIGRDCNLAYQHFKTCPIRQMHRGPRELTDDLIIKTTIQAYKELGFQGFIGWSLYNEPMLHAERMFNLMHSIRQAVPESRFVLWTNGTILIKDQRLSLFELIFVTNYFNLSVDTMVQFFGPHVGFKGNPTLDDRINYREVAKNTNPCTLPFDNFIVINDGEIYLCCMDWRNDVKIGNLFDMDLAALDQKRIEYINKISFGNMFEDAPTTCLHCRFKWNVAGFDLAIQKNALDMISAELLLRKGDTNEKSI